MFTSKNEVQRDERTTVVENASFSLAYKFVGFALLLDVAYRSFAKGDAAWDLLAIVIISGFLTTAYQIRNRIVNKGWAKTFVSAIRAASLTAFIIVLIRTVH
jgi:hypothetical protein